MDSRDKDILSRMATQVASLYEEWPKLAASIIHFENRFIEHERRIVSLEATRLAEEKKKSELALYGDRFDPEKTPHGGIRFDPAIWEQVRVKMAEQEAEKRGAEKARDEAQEESKRLRERITFYISIAATSSGGIAWALKHFFFR